MEYELIKYLSKYVPITKEIEAAIIESALFKNYSKGTILLKEGDISNECFFVIRGAIRCFCLKDGEEKTVEFYTDEAIVVPSAYGKKTPSEYYFECIEDTIASVGTPELEKEIYQKYPQLESLNRAIADVIMANHQDKFAEFKMGSPEERYLNLLKTRPDLIQRVPQHQIASYLGIKPESLSRIRKRIINKRPSQK